MRTACYWRIWLTAGLWLACVGAHARPAFDAAVAARNAEWTRAAAMVDLVALSKHYADDATVMPEHARVRRGRTHIQAYLQQWWQHAGVSGWERHTESLEQAGDYLLEIGRYAQRLQRTDATVVDYTGKYLAVWRTSPDGLQVVAELWGSNSPFERALLPELEAPAAIPAAIDTASEPVKHALAERNARITTLVRERRGAEHAELFTDDAAYLTYYTPPLRGMAAIRGYFVEHERPGAVTIDAIAIDSDGVRTLVADALYLEEGRYRVGWRAGGDSGVVEGKSLNLWKRDATGDWKLYRQAVNHD